MNYPFWPLEFAGGGLLIATIAIVHVYLAHFAIGGGLFLVITEIKGRRENNPAILDYVKLHARFFLLLTVVLGGLTGVGIWFTISVLNPAATSTLIHLFLFAWASEWLCFLGEIISIFIYYYAFDRLSPRDHLLVGWLYFAFAWLSLFFINGIIDFMLTPGDWLTTGSFWAAFFNPTFWPALFFRTFLALITTGLFGFVTAASLKDGKLRLNLLRYCALWLLLPFALFVASACWYRQVLPAGLTELIFQRMPEARDYFESFLIFSALLLPGGIGMAIHQPARISRVLAGIMLAVGLLNLGAFEFLRESGRRPFVIPGYMYANAIRPTDLERTTSIGVLRTARWVNFREITPADEKRSGREVYNLLCLACHSLGGPLNAIQDRLAGHTAEQVEQIIFEMGNLRPYMPPFAGNSQEREALLAYLGTLK